ncbi:MAG: tetratricopeptide repeat protein [Acidobacteria bacterium]|nr:tetratricopeptide repeat protein [Acidobacteriota bacterium]
MNLLFRVWINPVAAMGAILDRGSLLFASIAAIIATAVLNFFAPGLGVGYFMPALLVAAVYVPGLLLLASILARAGSPGMLIQRDYAPLLTCVAMAYAATEIPLALLLQFLPPVIALGIAVAYFALLVFFAVRTVLGSSNAAAAGIVALSWIPLLVVLLGPFMMILRYLASPFLLFYLWYFLGGEFAGLGDTLRRGQSYRRMLEAAAVNPHDGEAQYQLGLIHQQRRQYTEAINRFQRAVAIDPTLTDAHFQLGRIARRQGRLRDALGHFQTVIDQDERHSSSETLRELAAIYLAARQYNDARNELATYTERRPYDPEGLYDYGQAMENLGDSAAARDLYLRAIEAARTAPRYLRRTVAPWSRAAQKALARLA